MLHWLCDIGMSDLHDNNLVQGWEKKSEIQILFEMRKGKLIVFF